jgi:hypothetical protein
MKTNIKISAVATGYKSDKDGKPISDGKPVKEEGKK